MFLKELLCNLVLDGNIQNVLVSVQIFELATGFIKKKKKTAEDNGESHKEFIEN